MRNDGPISSVEADPELRNFPPEVQARILADAKASRTPQRQVPTPQPAPTPARVRPIFETDPPPMAPRRSATMDGYPLQGSALASLIGPPAPAPMPRAMRQQLAAQRGRQIPAGLTGDPGLPGDLKDAAAAGAETWFPIQLAQKGAAEAEALAAPPPLTRAIDYGSLAAAPAGPSLPRQVLGAVQDLGSSVADTYGRSLDTLGHAARGDVAGLGQDIQGLAPLGRGLAAGAMAGAVSLADPSNFIMPQGGGRLLQAGLGAASGLAQSVALDDAAGAPANVLTQTALGALTGGHVERRRLRPLSPGGITDGDARMLAGRLGRPEEPPRLEAELDPTPAPAPEAPLPVADKPNAAPAGARRGSIGTGPEPQRDARNRVQDTRTYPNTVNPDDHMNPTKWDVLDGPESARLRQLTADTVAAMHQDHKARRGVDRLDEKAALVTDEHIDNLIKQGYQEGRPLAEDEYRAVSGKLADLIPRITELHTQLAETNLMVNHAEVRKQLHDAEESAKGLIGLLSPSSSDKGRALAYLKEQAKQGFNADYWMRRAEREAGAALSGEQITGLATIIDRGKKADTHRKAKLTEAEDLRKRREALEAEDAAPEAPAHQAEAETHPLDALLQEFQPKAWDPAAARTPREPKPRKAPAPAAPKSVKELADYLKAEGASRIERNRGVSFMSSLGAGHADLALGHVQVLAGDMLHQAIHFADWAKQMHAQHGDGVIPHLPKIWTDAEKLARRVLEGKPLKARPEMDQRIRLEREADKTRPAALGGIVKKARTTVEKAEAKAAHDKAHAEAKAADRAHADAEQEVLDRRAALGRIVNQARGAVEKDKAAAAREAARAEQELANAMGKAREAAAKAREKADTLAQSAASRAHERAAERAARDEERAAAKAVEADTSAHEKELASLGEAMGKAREAAARAREKEVAAEGRAADNATQAAARAEVKAAEKAVDDLAEEMARAREAAAKARQRADEKASRESARADERAKSDEEKAAEKAAREEEKARLKAAEKAARAHAKAHAETVRQVNVDLAKYMAAIAPSTKLEVIAAFRKAGLLTGVKTIARNMGSNAANLALEEAVKLPASLFDTAISAFTKRRTVLAPTARKITRGLAETATTGVREFGETMVHGIPLDQLAAMEIPREINSGNKALDFYINNVFRFQSAQDRLFKAYAMRRSLDDQAALEIDRLARQRMTPVPKDLRREAIQELASKPTDEMLREAIADAEFMTFQNETWAARQVAGLRDASRRYGHGEEGWDGAGRRFAGKTGNFVIDLILPFSKTPSAVASRIVQYTPLGMVGTGAKIAHARWAKEVAGALTAQEQRAISMALSRGMVGSGLILAGAWLYGRGVMTPAYDQASRGTDEAANRTPGSISTHAIEEVGELVGLNFKVNGHWVPIGALSPIGNLMVLGATLAKEGWTSGAMMAGALRTVLDSPMSQGAKQLAEQANPGEEGLGRTANKFVGQMAGSFVPTLAAEAAQAFDSQGVDRQTSMEGAGRAALTNVAKRIPGARGMLPPKLDGLGQPVQVPSGLNAFGAFAGRPALEDTDPIVAELVSKGIQLRPAQRTITIRGVGVPLTEAEQMALFKLTGHYVREKLAHKIDSPTYGKAGEAHQEARLKDAIETATAKATREVRAELANKTERVKQAKAAKQQKQQTHARTVQGGARPAAATSQDLLTRPGSGDDATF